MYNHIINHVQPNVSMTFKIKLEGHSQIVKFHYWAQSVDLYNNTINQGEQNVTMTLKVNVIEQPDIKLKVCRNYGIPS